MSPAETFGINSIGPEQIGLDITSRCNMRCLHCYNRSGEAGCESHSLELTNGELHDLAKTVRQMRPIGFCFCGGEPLIRYDAIIDFMRTAENSFTGFSMVTNGYLMTPEKMKKLKDFGLRVLQVSIDGACPDTHDALRGVQGGYAKAIECIRSAKECRVPKIAVAFSPTQFNITQFPSVVEQMAEMGVSEVRVQPLMNLGAAVKNKNLFPSEHQYHWLWSQIRRLRRTNRKLSIELGDPIDHLFRCSEILYEYFSHVAIHADGDIVLSTYLPISVGNIRRHSLRQYWNAGLWKLWGRKLFREIARFYVCENDFSRVDVPVPPVFYSAPVRFDLIDDRLLFISDAELHRLYWSRVGDGTPSNYSGESDDTCFLRLKEAHLDMNLVYLTIGKRSVDASPKDIKNLVDGLIRKYGADASWTQHLHQSAHGLKVGQYELEELRPAALGDILDFLSDDGVQNDFTYRMPGTGKGSTLGVDIRAKMFYGTNRYFAVRDNERMIRGLFSVFLGNRDSPISYAEMLVGRGLSFEDLVRLVRFSLDEIASDDVSNLMRLRFILALENRDLKDELLRNGFCLIGTLHGSFDRHDLEFLEIKRLGGRDEHNIAKTCNVPQEDSLQ